MAKNLVSEKVETSLEKEIKNKKSVRTFFIDRDFLCQEETVEKFEIISETSPKRKARKIISNELVSTTTHEKYRFPLLKVDVKDLPSLRKNGKPGFILKENGQYYYAEITERFSVFSINIIGPHLCACNCARMRALPDSCGGCAKVRNRSKEGIEKYPWITVGYETYNCKNEAFVVIACGHYKKALEKGGHLNPADKCEMILTLASVIWPDIKDINDVRIRSEIARAKALAEAEALAEKKNSAKDVEKMEEDEIFW